MRPAVLPCLLAACAVQCAAAQEPSGPGDPERGRLELARAGCGACHVIPGVRGSAGRTGPPLDAYSRRIYIAGRLPNTPAALALWITDPPAIKPGTAMPASRIDAIAARDMAAYLLALE
jgi:cytochrome c1